MLKRHEIQKLLEAGHSQAEVARQAGASVRSVRRIAKEPPVTEADGQSFRKLRKVGRPTKVEAYRERVEKILKDDPGLKSVEVLHRVRKAGYQGGKTALYELIARLRPQGVDMVMRFEGVPGEFAQHDFGHVDVRFLDGTKRRVHFFASRMKYSRWSEVSLVPDEGTETLVRTLVSHYERIGGVPLLSVFDRPKTVALKWSKDGTVTEWNRTFAEVMLELGVGAELCWPHSPRQKGSVENLVKWVKGSFFKQRCFEDDEDLARQLQEWHHEVNHERPSRATEEIPAQRMEEEKARLRPLKKRPSELTLRYPVHVGPTAEVSFEANRYSMPPDAAGFSATLFLYVDRVRIIAGRFEAEHERLFGRQQRSVLPEHRTARLAAVSGKRGKRYLKRQDLLETGPAALEYISEVVHRRPRAWSQEVDRLHALLLDHGTDALADAFDRAVRAETYGAEYIAHYVRQPTLLAEAHP